MSILKYKPLLFRVQALTNLHAGGGDSFYGAVDKLVQRDPVTQRPTLFSHSVKGALREYFEKELGYETGSVAQKAFVTHVFGSPVSGNQSAASQGQYRFFSADLMAMPVPETDFNKPDSFKLCTQPNFWSELQSKVHSLGNESAAAASLKSVFTAGINPAFTDVTNLKEALEDLPVIARNHLDNGESKNLWYEEFVPHQSVFAFVVQVPQDDSHIIEFQNALNNKVVQIGANSTVGYGYCKFTLIKH
jgi:CRISPR-associated protein Cmr4